MEAVGKLGVLVYRSAMQEACEESTDINLDFVEKTSWTNILSMFAMMKYVLARMKRCSSVINSCSVAAYIENPMMVDYSSTKGAIATFTRPLAQQLAKN